MRLCGDAFGGVQLPSDHNLVAVAPTDETRPGSKAVDTEKREKAVATYGLFFARRVRLDGRVRAHDAGEKRGT